MPQLTVKTEYIEKLKALGVYDQWLANVKAQYDDRNELYIHITRFKDILYYPFHWPDTIEGKDFWGKIYES